MRADFAPTALLRLGFMLWLGLIPAQAAELVLAPRAVVETKAVFWPDRGA